MRKDVYFAEYIKDLVDFYAVNVDGRPEHDQNAYGVLKSRFTASKRRDYVFFVQVFFDTDGWNRFNFHLHLTADGKLNISETFESTAPQEAINIWEQLKRDRIAPLQKAIEGECDKFRSGTWGDDTAHPQWTIN
jgi:hypothetical protein